MPRESIYKSKNLKLRTLISAFLFIFTTFSFFSCVKKVEIDTKDPLSVELIYPKEVRQSSFVDIKVKVTNKGLYPITILNIQISNPDTTVYYKGTEYLKALKHKFRKSLRFNMEYYQNKKLAGRREHVVPEVHKMKSIVYPGKSKVFIVKALAGNINGDIYKNDITVNYIYLDESWKNKVYVFKGKSAPGKDTIVKELYEVQNILPQKLEGCLIASTDLGKAKNKNLDFYINLKGWNLKDKKVDAEYSIYLPQQDVWIYNDVKGTYILHKDGKKIQINGVNGVKPFIKTVMKGKVKVHIPVDSYKALEDITKSYKFILDRGYFDTKMNTSQLYDFLNKLLAKGYAFHKHGEVLKINN